MSILVDENTRIIIQGITGRDAASMSKEMLDYGAKVVAGVTPGKEGRVIHGIPIYDCVADAVRENPADATVISVPPAGARDAVMEAVESGIKLVVCLTERIPKLDVIEMVTYAHNHGARIIGPNSGGIISPGKTRLGYFGGQAVETYRAFKPGPVGLISRSGGMCTEISNLLTNGGVGQSTAIGMGGDLIIGSIYSDFLPLFQEDPQTKVVVLFCEPGGKKEEAAAEYIARNFTKPVVAFFGGKFVDSMPDIRFGHASVIIKHSSGSIVEKTKLFREVGVTVVDTYSEILTAVKNALRGGAA